MVVIPAVGNLPGGLYLSPYQAAPGAFCQLPPGACWPWWGVGGRRSCRRGGGTNPGIRSRLVGYRRWQCTAGSGTSWGGPTAEESPFTEGPLERDSSRTKNTNGSRSYAASGADGGDQGSG